MHKNIRLELELIPSHNPAKECYFLTSPDLPFLCLAYDDVEMLYAAVEPVVQTILWKNARIATIPDVWRFEELLAERRVTVAFRFQEGEMRAPDIAPHLGNWWSSPRGIHFFVPFINKERSVHPRFLEHIKRLTPGAS
ncbi:MAG: hypothetical protein KBE09_02415 [Candidatus Pacebacteria bacterium]|nr:hypothetical protein [Candidatus Paceibacterota bacterium]